MTNESEAVAYLESDDYWDVVDSMTDASNYPFGDRPEEYSTYSVNIQPMVSVRNDGCPFYEDTGECMCYPMSGQQYSDPQPTEQELDGWVANTISLLRVDYANRPRLIFKPNTLIE